MNKKIFLSYSCSDKIFVEWLITQLKNNSIDVWYDANELKVGDSLKDKIKDGIESSSTIIIVYSKNAVKSKWVESELNSALMHSSIRKGVRIIILKLDDVELPLDITNYLYLDFSSNKDKALKKLLDELSKKPINFSALNWSSLSSQQFEDLVFDLLKYQGLDVTRTPKTRDGSYDFIVNTFDKLGSKETIIIETKFYKDSKISIDILRRLYGYALTEKVNKAILITNSQLTNSSKEFVSGLAGNIAIWEEQTLLNKLYGNPALLEKYFSIKINKTSKPVKLIDKAFEEIQYLSACLDFCSPGKKGWKEYEDTCIKVLKHLFVPPLGEPKIQSRRESGVDIRDAIFPNRSKDHNWRFIREDYEAKYIVFEFKNYAPQGDPLDKHAVIQISDYLKSIIGKLGIICSPKAPNKSGLEKRKDIFIETGKLILFLTNEHLIEMLQRKYKKLAPSDVIIDLIDDFNLSF